jgi:hypothetical protein
MRRGEASRHNGGNTCAAMTVVESASLSRAGMTVEVDVPDIQAHI